MTRVGAQCLLDERVRRRTFANAGVSPGGIEENVIQTVDGVGLLRLPWLKPGVAEARNAIDQQLAKVIRGNRIAGQDAARPMQCLALRVDASVRTSKQIDDRKSRA